MKGYSTRIKVGPLRNEKVGSLNSASSVYSMNLRAKENALEGYSTFVRDFPAIYYSGVLLDVTIDWPFPQVFHTDTGIYIGTREGLYKITYVADQWVASSMLASYAGSIYWPWTLADTPMFPVFASGDCFVYYDYTNTTWISWNKLSTSTPHIFAGSLWHKDWYQPVATCAFNGQVICVGSGTGTTAPSESRIVRWSEIGAFNFLGKTADARKNTAGYLYAPSDDSEVLLNCMQLDNTVIVYGTFSVFTLFPVSTPVPAFGIRPLLNTGINFPLAVGGSKKKHLMVDRLGFLWLITSEKVTKLGYQEFFAPMVSNASNLAYNAGEMHNLISVVYNPTEDEFYISDGTTSYLYNDAGLTLISKSISGIVDLMETRITSNVDILLNNQFGFFRNTADAQVYYTSVPFDLGVRSIKVIESVDINMTGGITDAEVMIKWRNDTKGSFRDTVWKRVSPEGQVSSMIAGVELQICVRIPSHEEVELRDITVRWKLTDKRFIRGMYASSTST